MAELLLRTDELGVALDPEHGAEIVAIVDRRTGIDVMFSTPWRERAESVLQGRQHVISGDSQGRWLERYRGGWQVLVPHGGGEAVVGGATMGFHGEASEARWSVVSATETSAHLRCTLFTVPLVIDRRIEVSGTTVTVTDDLRNVASVDARVDYIHHPAFGGPFLEGDVRIETGAQRFVPHGDTIDARREGEQPHLWPTYTLADGTMRDLSVVAPVGSAQLTFGTLVDIAEPWATITNHTLGLAVRLQWDGEAMPYAWFWQELHHTPGWPWFARARVLAIEPSSTLTGGPDRESVLVVPAHSSRSVAIRVSLHAPDEESNV